MKGMASEIDARRIRVVVSQNGWAISGELDPVTSVSLGVANGWISLARHPSTRVGKHQDPGHAGLTRSAGNV